MATPGSIPSIGFKMWEGTPGGMNLPHSHPDIEINFLRAGRLTYVHGGAWHRLEPGQFNAFWAGLPHISVEASSDAVMSWITIPLTDALRWDLPPEFLGDLLLGRMVRDPARRALPEVDGPQLRQWQRDLADRDPAPSLARREIAARLHRLAHNWRRGTSRQRHAPQPSGAARRVFDYASTHYAEISSVADIARALKLHPKYLMQVFTRTFGMGLWDYVTRMRVAHAQRLLLTTDQPVTTVAFASGFTTLSAFYRAFAEATAGMKPAAFRRLSVN